MELDDRMISDLARQLGVRPGRGGGQDVIRQLESKSDAELEREILKIKEQLKANNVTYEKQLALLHPAETLLLDSVSVQIPCNRIKQLVHQKSSPFPAGIPRRY